MRCTFAARHPSARCDRGWIIRCKIAPPSGKGRRGKSPSICKEHLKTENLNDLPNFLRCSPNTRHRRPGLWTEPQKVLHEPTHLLGDLEKGKSKEKCWYQYIFPELRTSACGDDRNQDVALCPLYPIRLSSGSSGPYVENAWTGGILDRHRPGGQATRFSRLSLAIRHRHEVGRRNELPQDTEKAPE